MTTPVDDAAADQLIATVAHNTAHQVSAYQDSAAEVGHLEGQPIIETHLQLQTLIADALREYRRQLSAASHVPQAVRQVWMIQYVELDQDRYPTDHLHEDSGWFASRQEASNRAYELNAPTLTQYYDHIAAIEKANAKKQKRFDTEVDDYNILTAAGRRRPRPRQPVLTGPPEFAAWKLDKRWFEPIEIERG